MALLLAGSALLGTFAVFCSSAAAAIFLQVFGAGALPYLYVGSALLVATSGVCYAQLESRVPVRHLLPGTLGVLLVAVLALRAALALGGPTWPAILLAGFGELAASFVPLTFWALAGRLFDVRQAKRLYGPVGAGEVAATAIGGFAAPVVVGLIGTNNLLFLCAAALAGLIAVYLAVVRGFAASFADAEQTAEQRRFKLASNARPPLGSPYVVLMLLFAVLATVTYYFVATSFLVQAQSEFPTQDALAGFLGVFTGVLSVVGFAGRSLVAGRVMARFGIRISLLLAPLAVAVTAVLVLAADFLPELGRGSLTEFAWLSGIAGLLFYANCLNRICMETTWDSVYKPAFLVLYQPLPARSRLWLQTVVEGVAAPLAQGLTGVCLLAYGTFRGFEPVGLSAVALGLALAWLVVGSMTGHRYLRELLAAVRRRALDFGGRAGQAGHRAVADPASLHALEGHLTAEEPDDVLYCLGMLDDADYPRIETILISLTGHASPKVRAEALRRIGRRALPDAATRVKAVFLEDEETAVRAEALRALAAVDPEGALPLLQEAIDHGAPEVRRAGLVGMLRGTGRPEIEARQRVQALLGSLEEQDRVLAAEAIGEAGETQLHFAIGRLMRDDALAVRRAALKAAGELNHPDLWPRVVQRLLNPDTARAAATALIEAGPTAMPFLVAAFLTPEAPRALKMTIIRLCGRIRNQEAVQLLQRALEARDADVRRRTLRAMDACQYRANLTLAERIPRLVAQEVAAGAWITAAQLDLQALPEGTLPEHVRNTFAAELDFARERALLLLSLVYEPGPLVRCAGLLLGDNPERRAYAMEILDNLVPHAIKQTLFPLLDALGPEARLAALAPAFPQERMAPEARLRALVSRPLARCHPWSLACWTHLAATLRLDGIHKALEASARSESPLVAETAAWALTQVPAETASPAPAPAAAT